jgi:hypothetical protein
MRVVERRRSLAYDRDRFVDSEAFVTVELLSQRLAGDVGHDVEQPAVSLAGIVQREDVCMVQLRGDRDSPRETVRSTIVVNSGRSSFTATLRWWRKSSAR